MPTRRLFDSDPACLDFTARVLSCSPGADGLFLVSLDQTAFFPEGGGQGADQGTLDQARVLDVHEKDGVIRHLTDAPLAPGSAVRGRVDARRRLDMCQQHTGEHILTGVAHREWGVENVGFHIGTEAVTVDFSIPLTEEQVRSLEVMANGVVWADLPVRVWYPGPSELETLVYRSKKAIDGALRIVSIEGVDTCACCGTHVPRTGGVGQIRILSAIHYKGGMRLQILCGRRALLWERGQQEENRSVSRLLSAKSGELAAAVERLLAERDELKARADELAWTVFAQTLEAERGRAVRVADVTGLDPASLPRAASRLSEGARLGLALARSADGWRFALCGAASGEKARALCAAFGGKGGGRGDLAQGSLKAGSPEECRALLTEDL